MALDQIFENPLIWTFKSLQKKAIQENLQNIMDSISIENLFSAQILPKCRKLRFRNTRISIILGCCLTPPPPPPKKNQGPGYAPAPGSSNSGVIKRELTLKYCVRKYFLIGQVLLITHTNYIYCQKAYNLGNLKKSIYGLENFVLRWLWTKFQISIWLYSRKYFLIS